MTSEATRTAPTRKRRGLLTYAFLLLGGLLILVALLPWLAGPTIVRKVLASESEKRAGTLEVDSVSLGWLSGIEIEGLRVSDEQGAEVAQLTVTAPSLLKLASGMGKDLGHVTISGRAAIAADADGKTNLDRALANADGSVDAVAESASSEMPNELPSLTLDLNLERVSWSDPTTREKGVTLGVENLVGHFVIDTGATSTIELTGGMLGNPDSELNVNASIERPLAALDGDNPPHFEVSVDIEGIATGLLDAFAGTDGALRDLCGDSVSILMDGEGTPQAGSVDASVRADEFDLVTALDLKDGILSEADASAPLSLELRSVDAILARAADSMPPGASVRRVGDAPIKLDISHLALPLEDVFSAEDPVAAVLATLNATVVATLPALEYAHPKIDTTQAPTLIRLANARLDTKLSAGAAAAGTFAAEVGSGNVGSLVATFMCPDPQRALDENAPPIEFTALLKDLPTALVDELANQNGLLIDVLGAKLQGDLKGTWPLEAKPLEANLNSSSGTIAIIASTTDSVMHAGVNGKVNANVGLTPLLSKRIVGGLLPLMVEVAKQDPSERISLNVSDFSLPLDGDLTKLSATVGLDLGLVNYRVLPGLDQLLALTGGKSLARSTAFESLTLRIENGLVNYERLPLSVDGQDYPLVGSFSLATQELDLGAELPLSILGSDVTGFLGKASSVLSSSSLVPLRLQGTWKRPRISVPDDFVQGLLKQAGENLLEEGLKKGLGKGLRGLLGRD